MIEVSDKLKLEDIVNKCKYFEIKCDSSTKQQEFEKRNYVNRIFSETAPRNISYFL
ncbi:unnamed protein product [Hymenolepis diminuta]|uniref:Uncharacterized protein n=1 Tax=Hymenolepis diminuta TaxID=6216 RepID=A0A564YFY5_HYMDI|nr:unnamed protein product [Hymenolepis diminuta]